MLIALLFASIAVDPPQGAPILAADTHFECTAGTTCFMLTRDGSDLLVPADREWMEPLQNTVKAGNRAGLGRMLQVGTAFRVASGMPVLILEAGPSVAAGRLMGKRETSVVVPHTSGKHPLYWKVRLLADPVRDRIALVAPENLGRLAEFDAASQSRVRVANTPAHAAVAAFCHAADVDNVSNTTDALMLYQGMLDKYPKSDAAGLALERIRALNKQR